MIKKDLTETFIGEIYSSPPKKSYPTNKILYNHIDRKWSLDLADLSDYTISNNKNYRYIFAIKDNNSTYSWAIPLKNRNSQTTTQQFSEILTTSKWSPINLDSDRGLEWYNSTFESFLKSKNIHHYSRFTDKVRSIAERVLRNIRSSFKKSVFDKRDADGVSELSSVIKKYNNTGYNSTKLTPTQGSRKVKEKVVYNNLQHWRVRQ